MWIFRPFFMHRRWSTLRFDVENREENVIKHIHSPSGDVQIIYLMESMQTTIRCDWGISAHTPISRFRNTNGIWEQWYDFVPRAGWTAVWWGMDEWRERLSLSRIEAERRELIMCDGLKKDVWLCAFLCWKRSMNGVAQHSKCRLVGSVWRNVDEGEGWKVWTELSRFVMHETV